jgi:hypothetical protein
MAPALRAEDELLMLAAGTLARRRATIGRARELLGQASWPAILEELSRQRLVPLLGGRIVEAAGSRAPAAFRRAVETETLAARQAGAVLELVALRIAAALEGAGLPCVLLKGPVLARALHGDPAMRFSRDIDVLVARDGLGRAVDALAPLGWRPDAAAAAPVLHVRLVSEANVPDVEVHWRLHWYETEFAARALARAQPGPEWVRRMRKEDELAALLLYYARDGFAGLRYATDVAAWWDGHAPAARRPLLGGIVREHAALARALTASAVVVQRVVGVPAEALVPLPARLPWGLRRAAGLANPLMRGTPAQITAEATLVDGLLAPGGKRRAFLRRRALPTARQLPADLRDRPLTIARTAHVVRLVRRYTLALARPRPRLPRELPLR